MGPERSATSARCRKSCARAGCDDEDRALAETSRDTARPDPSRHSKFGTAHRGSQPANRLSARAPLGPTRAPDAGPCPTLQRKPTCNGQGTATPAAARSPELCAVVSLNTAHVRRREPVKSAAQLDTRSSRSASRPAASGSAKVGRAHPVPREPR